MYICIYIYIYIYTYVYDYTVHTHTQGIGTDRLGSVSLLGIHVRASARTGLRKEEEVIYIYTYVYINEYSEACI